MDELIDERVTMKEKRGKTLPVLCVLSWIWIAFTAGSMLLSLVNGPMTEEDIEEQTVQIMEAYDESMPQFYTDMLIESIATLQVVADNFWLITGVQALSLIIGFFAIYMMFKLKKTGFFLYLAYSIIPAIMTLSLFSGFKLSMFGLVISGIFSVLFIILYGAQLKRMS